MLRLLASRLLKKLPAAWKATRKPQDELERKAKKRRQSREIRPADSSKYCPAQRTGTSAPPRLEGNPQTSRQLISHQRAWQRVRIAVNFGPRFFWQLRSTFACGQTMRCPATRRRSTRRAGQQPSSRRSGPVGRQTRPDSLCLSSSVDLGRPVVCPTRQRLDQPLPKVAADAWHISPAP